MESMTGEEIATMAYALPPISPKGLGPAVEVTAILFGIICVIVVGLRVYVRLGFSGASVNHWGPEDYLVIIGSLPFIPAVVFAVLAAHHGVGMHDVDIPNPLYPIRAMEYLIIWELHYFVSSTIIKCAVGFACMRLDRRRRVVYPIVVNLTVMIITFILALVFVFANCKPLSATWNPALGTCQKVITLELVSYIISAIQMATDWASAAIPCYIVAGLQMSRRKKISAIMILSLGITASVATCIRMPYLKYYDVAKYPEELLYHLGPIIITSNIECSLGIIACSLPPLRKLFKLYYGETSRNGKTDDYTNESGRFGSRNRHIQLSSIGDHGKSTYEANVKATMPGSHDDDDTSSRKGIIRQTDVYVH